MRRTPGLRGLVRETALAPSDLVQPLFVKEDPGPPEAISGMPGIERLPLRSVVERAEEVASAGVPAVLVFGVPATRDEAGSPAFDDEGVVQSAVRTLKRELPGLTVITDVCLCAYTTHGHCGFVRNGEVDNDLTVELLSKVAVSHAEAGADVVAPSDMMDGRVASIRHQLEEEGHPEVAILSYAAKFRSALYGPFRDAAGSSPQGGDRSGYQMDPANGDEAVREALLDLSEGADALMVKPAGGYLDIVRRVKEATAAPVAAYQVSGEYSMLKGAAAANLVVERDAVLESLTGIRRAGADFIVTYYAREAAGWLG
jgi:porphobilinogen synthase